MDTLTPDNLMPFAAAILDAVRNSNWSLVAALAVVGLVWLTRKYGAKRVPFLGTGAGGAVLSVAYAFGGALLNAVLAGAPISGPLLGSAFVIAFTASGGYSIFHELAPYLRERLGPKARTVLDFVLAFIPKPPAPPSLEELAKAEAEGDKAAEAVKVRSPMEIANGE